MKHGNPRLLGQVFRDSPSAGTTLLVILAIAETTQRDGWSAASIAELAKLARVRERQVQRALGELAASGEVEIRRGVGRGRTSGYRIAPAGNGEKASAMTPFTGEKGVRDDTFSRGTKVSPTTPFRGQKDVKEDTLSAQKPGKGVKDDTFSSRARAAKPKPSQKRQHHPHPQSEAVGRVLRIFRDHGLEFAPSPSQVGIWLKDVPVEQLVEVIEEQIGAGLDQRQKPLAYLFRCVKSAAEGNYRRVPRQAGLPLGAGGDDGRIAQAEQLMEPET